MQNLTKIKYSREGDKLKVELQDNSFNTYFKRRVDINNKKDMKDLMEALKAKGVNFPVDFL